MSKITIPGALVRIDPRDEVRLEELYRRLGNARRRAYILNNAAFRKPRSSGFCRSSWG